MDQDELLNERRKQEDDFLREWAEDFRAQTKRQIEEARREAAAIQAADDARVLAEAQRLQAENDAREAENAARREAEAQSERPSHSRKIP